MFAATAVGWGRLLLTQATVPERAVLQPVVHPVDVGGGSGVDGEQCVFGDGSLRQAPYLPLLLRTNVCQRQARIRSGLQAACVGGYRAKDDIKAMPGRVGDRICQALLGRLAGEHPVLGDGVWTSATVVEAEAPAASRQSLSQAVRRRASKELTGPWDVSSINQDGLQWSA